MKPIDKTLPPKRYVDQIRPETPAKVLPFVARPNDMNKPDYAVQGVMRCGDCGRPLKLGVRGVASCKNPECVRNKPKKNRTTQGPG